MPLCFYCEKSPMQMNIRVGDFCVTLRHLLLISEDET
jgi:hypothetical protein